MNHIDAKGKACPMPVMMAKKEMDTGCEALSITVDNAIAVQNLSRLAESQGFAAETAEENGCYTITMHRTGAPAQEMPEELLNCAVPAASDYVVFAGRDVIGEGDPELGHSLIKMFFYTLSEKPDLPSAICFMNNGVRLVTENEQTIEHLKVLEAKGVKLIVCGTCLNFYGLTDKLQCGTIGNMYDIVETMTKAGKVITIQMEDLVPEVTLEELKKSWIARANTPCIFLSALAKTNLEKFRSDLYGMVREIHAGRYPFNNFLY